MFHALIILTAYQHVIGVNDRPEFRVCGVTSHRLTFKSIQSRAEIVKKINDEADRIGHMFDVVEWED